MGYDGEKIFVLSVAVLFQFHLYRLCVVQKRCHQAAEELSYWDDDDDDARKEVGGREEEEDDEEEMMPCSHTSIVSHPYPIPCSGCCFAFVFCFRVLISFGSGGVLIFAFEICPFLSVCTTCTEIVERIRTPQCMLSSVFL